MNEPAMPATVKDPVCGMDVNRDVATALGLRSEHDGQSYFFCARGCKLSFDEHPSKYLDPGHVPSM